jgi:hypothetical protein
MAMSASKLACPRLLIIGFFGRQYSKERISWEFMLTEANLPAATCQVFFLWINELRSFLKTFYSIKTRKLKLTVS